MMNMLININIGADFGARAIEVLRAIPELTVTVSREPDARTDAVVRYGDMQTSVVVEFKTRVSSAGAYLIIHQARQVNMPLVVVAAEMTGKARELLSDAGIGLVDGVGNVRLELPGLVMRIAGNARVSRRAVPVRLSGKSGLIAQAMLLATERAWHISDLSRQSGVSAGLVHRVLRRLEDEGVVDTQGAGPAKTRRLANPAAVLDLWAEEHRDRSVRQPAFMLAQTTDRMIRALCSGLEAAGVDYALTGAAAVARLAPFVTNVSVAEVWLGSRVDALDVCEELGATPVEAGPNVVFLQEQDDGPLAFRTHEDGVWLPNVFRLYVDVRRDPRRGREQSEHLRREVIGF